MFNRRFGIGILGLVVLIIGLLALNLCRKYSGFDSLQLSKLPHFYDCMPNYNTNDYGGFRVTPYINAAIKLQCLGRIDAEKRLVAYAKQDRWHSDQVFILCRMLYTKSNLTEFKSPSLGQPSYMGGTLDADWPATPIENVEGVPFLITTGYALYGVPATSIDYLSYCTEHCEWNTNIYQKKNMTELEHALNKLYRSSVWKRPLTDQELDWLKKQIAD
jgi:hypothetical protein